MTATKKVNYTPEVVKTMLEIYGAAGTEPEQHEARQAAMEEIAEFAGKTVASVRAKLSAEGVYIKKPEVEKSVTTRVLKSDLVAQIADNADMKNPEFFESLAGANKAVLEYILDLQGAEDAEEDIQPE